MGGPVVAGDPKLLAVAVIFHRRVVEIIQAIGVTRHIDVPCRINLEGFGKIIAVTRSVKAGHPDLITIGVILDCEVVRLPIGAVRRARNIHVSRGVHAHGRGLIKPFGRTVITRRPKLAGVPVILDCHEIRVGAVG